MTEAYFDSVGGREALLDAVEGVARAGAERALAHWRRLGADEVDEKGRNDLVTVADREAEEAIVAAIRDRFPDHAVIAEESGADDDDRSGFRWIVDPIDGTTNYVHAFPHWAVSVAVAFDGWPIAGVVLDPVKGDTFRAARGGGAWRNGERCRVTRRDRLAGALLATGFPFRCHRLIDEYLALFRDVFLASGGVRRPGAAALDFAYVACGALDGFFELGLEPWDIAAGAVLVEEAGGVVTGITGNPDHLSTGHVVCAPAGVHRELVALTRRHATSILGP